MLPLSDAVQFKAPLNHESGVTSALAAASTLLTGLAWPIAVILIVWMLLRSPPIQVLLSKLPRHVTQLNVAGLEIRLSAGAAATLDDLEKLVGQIPDTHKEWVSNSHLRPQFQLVISDIKSYLTTDACDSGAPIDQSDFGSFRFTLHVPDVLLEHSFRQLVDYAGKGRGGAGRIFSMRIGIIGKAWRMERSDFVADNTYSEDQLVETWGMTRPEARDTSGNRKVHLAVLIRSDQGLPLAVLYGDAETSQLFNTARCLPTARSDKEVFGLLEAQVIAASKNRGLTQSLALLEDQRRKVKQLDLYNLYRKTN